MSAPSLSVQARGFGHRRPLFSPLSIDCRSGEVWAVLGANGCGKSTLFATISGALKPLAGQVSAGDGVSVVPQSFRPAFGWRVQEVVLMGRARRVSLFGQPSAADEMQVTAALAQLGIAHLAQRPFNRLSGGQQQLVMIARALVGGSETILLDEPCSALDLANQQAVLQLISDLARRQGRCVLFSTHDPAHAARVASHALLLLPGGEWLAGESGKVLTEEALQRACGLPVRRLMPGDGAEPLLAPLFTLRR